MKKGWRESSSQATRLQQQAVMSGASGGVQAYFQNKHPEAIYVHCYAHKLNLVLCHTCKAISEAAQLFNVLQMNAVLENFLAITGCLSCINTPLAVGLKAKLSHFHMVYLLHIFQELLSVTADFHQYLQKETIDLADAVAHKNAVTDSLEEKRSDATAADLHARTRAFCEANQVAFPEPRMHTKKRMEGFVVESTCGAGSEVCGSSESEELKRKWFFPCVDRMIAELEKRFSGVNEELLKGIQACSPTSDVFLCKPYLSGLAAPY
ncbi:hypothetical protein N1851_033712 [Merluccius polli]|uniref:DUF4371 domain-containing protein n=1 Tax=Merluccius polli TaxID=89951 RepID=A0AA47M0X7_MERPO|nr:hypothetical protein N1851_033712 [Merluccius polli]